MKDVISQMHQTRHTLLDMLKDFTLEQLNEIPAKFNNNIAWNLGHIVAAQQGVCYLRSKLELRVEQSFFDTFKPGSKPEKDITTAELETIKKLMFDSLVQLEADYEKKIFTGFTPFLTLTGVQLNSIEDAIKFLLFHDGIHRGVIMSLRKLV